MNRPTSSPFDIKSATIQGLSLVLRTANMGVIDAELAARVANAGDLFTNAPVLIDVTALTADGNAEKLELVRLMNMLRRHTMRAVGIVGARGVVLTQAQALGLTEEQDVRPKPRRAAQVEPEPAPSNAPAPADAPATRPSDLFETGPAAAAASAPTPQAASGATATPRVAPASPPEARGSAKASTMVVERPLRSGQRVYARGADLVVLGMVSNGAEVIADGSIHVYGPLRGRAIAGASGDVSARVFAAAMEPELISIAGTYRTTDKPLADAVRGKAAHARLDGERMLIEPLKN